MRNWNKSERSKVQFYLIIKDISMVMKLWKRIKKMFQLFNTKYSNEEFFFTCSESYII